MRDKNLLRNKILAFFLILILSLEVFPPLASAATDLNQIDNTALRQACGVIGLLTVEECCTRVSQVCRYLEQRPPTPAEEEKISVLPFGFKDDTFELTEPKFRCTNVREVVQSGKEGEQITVNLVLGAEPQKEASCFLGERQFGPHPPWVRIVFDGKTLRAFDVYKELESELNAAKAARNNALEKELKLKMSRIRADRYFARGDYANALREYEYIGRYGSDLTAFKFGLNAARWDYLNKKRTYEQIRGKGGAQEEIAREEYRKAVEAYDKFLKETKNNLARSLTYDKSKNFLLDRSKVSQEQLVQMDEDKQRSSELLNKLRADTYKRGFEGKTGKLFDFIDAVELFQRTHDPEAAGNILKFLVDDSSSEGNFGHAVNYVKHLRQEAGDSGFGAETSVSKLITGFVTPSLFVRGEIQNAKDKEIFDGAYIQTKVDPQFRDAVRQNVNKEDLDSAAQRYSQIAASERQVYEDSLRFFANTRDAFSDVEGRSGIRRGAEGVLGIITDTAIEGVDLVKTAGNYFSGTDYWETKERKVAREIASLEQRQTEERTSFERFSKLSLEDQQKILSAAKTLGERDARPLDFRPIDYGLSPEDMTNLQKLNQRSNGGLLADIMQLNSGNEAEALAAQFSERASTVSDFNQNQNLETAFHGVGINPETGTYQEYDPDTVNPLFYVQFPFQVLTHGKHALRVSLFDTYGDAERFNEGLKSQQNGLQTLSNVVGSGNTDINNWAGLSAEETQRNLQARGISLSINEARDLQQALEKDAFVLGRRSEEALGNLNFDHARQLRADLLEQQSDYNYQIGRYSLAREQLVEAASFNPNKDYSEKINEANRAWWVNDLGSAAEQAGNVAIGGYLMGGIGQLGGRASGAVAEYSGLSSSLRGTSLGRWATQTTLEGYQGQAIGLMDDFTRTSATGGGRLRALINAEVTSADTQAMKAANSRLASAVESQNVQAAERALAEMQAIAERNSLTRQILGDGTLYRGVRGASDRLRTLEFYYNPKEWADEAIDEAVGEIGESTKAYGQTLGSSLALGISRSSRVNVVTNTRPFKERDVTSYDLFIQDSGERFARESEGMQAVYQGLKFDSVSFDENQNIVLSVEGGPSLTVRDMGTLAEAKFFTSDGRASDFNRQISALSINSKYNVLNEQLTESEDRAQMEEDLGQIRAIKQEREALDAGARLEIARANFGIADAERRNAISQGLDASESEASLIQSQIALRQAEENYYGLARRIHGQDAEGLNGELDSLRAQPQDEATRRLIATGELSLSERRVQEAEMAKAEAVARAQRISRQTQEVLARAESASRDAQLMALEEQNAAAQSDVVNAELNLIEAQTNSEMQFRNALELKKEDVPWYDVLRGGRDRKALDKQIRYSLERSQRLSEQRDLFRREIARNEILRRAAEGENIPREIVEEARVSTELKTKAAELSKEENKLSGEVASSDPQQRPVSEEVEGLAALLRDSSEQRERFEEASSESTERIAESARNNEISLPLPDVGEEILGEAEGLVLPPGEVETPVIPAEVSERIAQIDSEIANLRAGRHYEPAQYLGISNVKVIEGATKLGVMGDVQGNYLTTLESLQRAGFVNAQGDWIGGDAVFVFVGDLVDRGSDAKSAIDLIIKLQSQATAAGGRVLTVRGNHDQMIINALSATGIGADVNIFQNLDLHPAGGWWKQGGKETALSFLRSAGISTSGKTNQQLFDEFKNYMTNTPEGRSYLGWFNQIPFAVRVNGILMVHGGPDFAATKIEDLGRSALSQKKVMWIRDWEDGGKGDVDKFKGDMGATAIVYGHTPKGKNIAWGLQWEGNLDAQNGIFGINFVPFETSNQNAQGTLIFDERGIQTIFGKEIVFGEKRDKSLSNENTLAKDRVTKAAALEAEKAALLGQAAVAGPAPLTSAQATRLIQGATNFDALYAALDQVGPIVVEGIEVSPEQLKDVISGVRGVDGKLIRAIGEVPRAGGLRNKVWELQQAERNEIREKTRVEIAARLARERGLLNLALQEIAYSRNPLTRGSAARQIATLLSDPDISQSLTAEQKDFAVNFLVQGLRDTDPGVVSDTVLALSSLRDRAAAIPKLLQAVENPDAYYSPEAQAQILPEILEANKNQLRANAIRALAALNYEGAGYLDVLGELAQDSDLRVRSEAVRALSLSRNEGVVPVLARSLTTDTEISVREEAAGGLTLAGTSEAIDAMVGVLNNPGESPAMRESIKDKLQLLDAEGRLSFEQRLALENYLTATGRVLGEAEAQRVLSEVSVPEELVLTETPEQKARRELDLWLDAAARPGQIEFATLPSGVDAFVNTEGIIVMDRQTFSNPDGSINWPKVKQTLARSRTLGIFGQIGDAHKARVRYAFMGDQVFANRFLASKQIITRTLGLEGYSDLDIMAELLALRNGNAHLRYGVELQPMLAYVDQVMTRIGEIDPDLKRALLSPVTFATGTAEIEMSSLAQKIQSDAREAGEGRVLVKAPVAVSLDLRNRAEQVLGRRISFEEYRAIVFAHEVGQGHFLGERNPDGTYKKHSNPDLAYSFIEIAQKNRILETAGFTQEERRKLIEFGLAGKTQQVDIRPRIKEIVRKAEGTLTQEERDFVLGLEDEQISYLEGAMAKADFRRLDRLIDSLRPVEEAQREFGPSLSEADYSRIAGAISDFLGSPVVSITGESFSDISMTFMVEGSLVEGWSNAKNRPSDPTTTAGQEVSDLDLLLVVSNEYWNAIASSVSGVDVKVFEGVPRTIPFGLETAGLIDPALADLINELDALSLAGRTDREIHLLIMPQSSLELRDPITQQVVYENVPAPNLGEEPILGSERGATTIFSDFFFTVRDFFNRFFGRNPIEPTTSSTPLGESLFKETSQLTTIFTDETVLAEMHALQQSGSGGFGLYQYILEKSVASGSRKAPLLDFLLRKLSDERIIDPDYNWQIAQEYLETFGRENIDRDAEEILKQMDAFFTLSSDFNSLMNDKVDKAESENQQTFYSDVKHAAGNVFTLIPGKFLDVFEKAKAIVIEGEDAEQLARLEGDRALGKENFRALYISGSTHQDYFVDKITPENYRFIFSTPLSGGQEGAKADFYIDKNGLPHLTFWTQTSTLHHLPVLYSYFLNEPLAEEVPTDVALRSSGLELQSYGKKVVSVQIRSHIHDDLLREIKNNPDFFSIQENKESIVRLIKETKNALTESIPRSVIDDSLIDRNGQIIIGVRKEFEGALLPELEGFVIFYEE